MLQRFCDNMYKAALLPSTDNDFQDSDFILYIYIYIYIYIFKAKMLSLHVCAIHN